MFSLGASDTDELKEFASINEVLFWLAHELKEFTSVNEVLFWLRDGSSVCNKTEG